MCGKRHEALSALWQCRGRITVVSYNKILGGLIGGAAGDAMGAATEARSYGQIIKEWGAKVTDLVAPPMDTFGRGNEAGGFTDDFSSAFFVADEIVKNNGIVDEEAVKRALIEWSRHPEFFDRFAGPTTRLAIRRFEGEKIEESTGVKNKSRSATNGSAMRISPLGLINAGNIEKAINDAVLVAGITHNNTLALSGACAVSAAVCKATDEGADIYDVIEAGIYGAKRGEKTGLERGSKVAGPSVVKRLELAADIGLGKGTVEEKVLQIYDVIGTGLHISSAVPSAFGFAAACGGDTMTTLTEAINAGYDTDTVGTMAGALVGALNGADSFPDHFLPVMEKANGLMIKELADRIYALHRAKADR